MNRRNYIDHVHTPKVNGRKRFCYTHDVYVLIIGSTQRVYSTGLVVASASVVSARTNKRHLMM